MTENVSATCFLFAFPSPRKVFSILIIAAAGEGGGGWGVLLEGPLFVNVICVVTSPGIRAVVQRGLAGAH